MRHLIDNPCGNRAHDVVRDARPVGGHEVVRRDRADGDGVVVRPLVAHDAHGADARQDGEILVDIGVQTGELLRTLNVNGDADTEASAPEETEE